MDQAGHGGLAPALDVGGGPGDGPGGRQPTEQGAGDIGEPLPHELLVGIVLLARLTVGNHRGKQALDTRQHGDAEGR